MATVNPQITLAKEIGENEGYQTYLIRVKQVEATRDVGIAQAGALEKADVKIISQTGTPSEGLNAVGELFTAKGGQAIGSALEGFKNTEAGAAVLHAVTKSGASK
jgi:flotillin